MNAQFPIATTLKYNFPSPKETLQLHQLPKHFIELSLQSLKQTKHQQILPTKKTTTQFSTHQRPQPPIPTTELLTLTPNPTTTNIVAIDVSSVKLGETKTGILLGVRGAVVWKNPDHYRYLRLGPFPFHITQHIENRIRRLYHQNHAASYLQENSIPQAYFIQSRLTTLLERWIQSSIAHTTHNSIILWDGSLTAGTTETSVSTMQELLATARSNRNIILAFSKMTRLSLQGIRLTDLIKHTPPCLLRIKEYTDCIGPLRLMGNVYVAKFTKGSFAFRMDADKQLPSVRVVDAVQNLLGNDLILQSYPETLRLAHIFSTFTAIEVLGLQRCIIQKSNLKVVTKLNMHRLLFGRFGKGPEG